MGASHLASLFSNLFRFCAWVFLRIIPTTLGKYVLPGLYLAYITFLFFSKEGSPKPTISIPPKKSNEEKLNGDTKELDEPVVEQKLPSQSSLATVLFSLPSSSRTHRLVNFAINTLLFQCALELVLYPVIDDASDVVFTRVGAVYPDAVKITVRHPFANATDGMIQIVWRQASEAFSTETETWRDGPLVVLNEDSDWTSTVKLTGLWPSTSYEYRLADISKYMLSIPAQPIPFRTFPDPRIPAGHHFRFIVSSCATPNFPYAPFNGRRIKGFDMLAEYLWPTPPEPAPVPAEIIDAEDIPFEKKLTASAPTAQVVVDDAPEDIAEHVSLDVHTTVLEESSHNDTVALPLPPAEFMMFLGDFIYADVPVWWGDDKEAYRRLYRRNYNSPSFRRVYEKLPIFHIYDDHEIFNDFAGLGNDTHPFENASDAYTIYNSLPNFDTIHPDEHYYEFQYGDVAFFVMDTRRYRSDVNTEDEATRTMLGERQLTALYEWLGKVNTTTTFKFVVSSVPLTSLWSHGTNDTWGGFITERDTILEAFHSVPNIVVLSGDRHESAIIEFNAPNVTGYRVFEVSASPLSMFYIPLYRTMLPRSNSTVHRLSQYVEVDGEGIEHVVEIAEDIPKENVLNYTPIGNIKWSSIEVDTRDLDHPLARVELVTDGKVAYKFEIAGAPVKLKSTTALSAFVPQGISDLLEKIGFNPSKWFP